MTTAKAREYRCRVGGSNLCYTGTGCVGFKSPQLASVDFGQNLPENDGGKAFNQLRYDSRYFDGLTGEEFLRTSKWSFGDLALPLMPERAISSPRRTF